MKTIITKEFQTCEVCNKKIKKIIEYDGKKMCRTCFLRAQFNNNKHTIKIKQLVKKRLAILNYVHRKNMQLFVINARKK